MWSIVAFVISCLAMMVTMYNRQYIWMAVFICFAAVAAMSFILSEPKDE